MIKIVTMLAVASFSILIGGCSTLGDVKAVKPSFKVLNNAAYRDADPTNDLLYGAMLDDLLLDQSFADDGAGDWSRAESIFSIGLLAAAAYGGFNTVYDGGNLEDAAFAAASITSIRTFVAPQKRRLAFGKAAAELACVADHAKEFSDYSQSAFTPKAAGGVEMSVILSTPVGAVDPSSALQTPVLTSQLSTLNDLLVELTTKAEKSLPEDNYSAAQVEAIASARVDQDRRIAALNEALARIIQAKALQNEILNERFSLVRGEYGAILADLFEALHFPVVNFESESAAFAKAKIDEMAAGMAGAGAEALMTFAGGPAGLATLAFRDPKRLAEAKTALLLCNKDE